jgi:hypothetical protein
MAAPTLMPVTAGKKMAKTCQKVTLDPDGEYGKDDKLDLENEVCPHVSKQTKCESHCRRKDSGIKARKDCRESLCKPDDVEGHGDSQGQVEGDADGTTDLQSQGPRDHVIGSSGLDVHVRRNGGQGETGKKRDQVSHHNDGEGSYQSGVTDDPTDSKEQDDPQDGEHTRCEDTPESTETALSSYFNPSSIIAHG